MMTSSIEGLRQVWEDPNNSKAQRLVPIVVYLSQIGGKTISDVRMMADNIGLGMAPGSGLPYDVINGHTNRTNFPGMACVQLDDSGVIESTVNFDRLYAERCVGMCPMRDCKVFQTLRHQEQDNPLLIELMREGIHDGNQKQYVIDSTMGNKAIEFFGYILDKNDPRWALVEKWTQLDTAKAFRGLNFENALLAIYLSDIPSFRRNYGQYTFIEGLRHLSRAAINIQMRDAFEPMLSNFGKYAFGLGESGSVEFNYVRTERIKKGATQGGVTGCPEALHQIRAMLSDGTYLGRIGFNCHREWDTVVVSLTNIQGGEAGNQSQERPINSYVNKVRRYLKGKHLFHYMIDILKDIAPESKGYKYRALANPKVVSPVYETTFKSTGIALYPFVRY